MMRRLLVIVLAVGLFGVLPAGSALAQEVATTNLVVRVNETSTGIADDGALLAAGTFRVFVDGTLIENGTTESAYYVDEATGNVTGTRTYTAESGAGVVTSARARLISADEATGRFIYHTTQNQIGGNVNIGLLKTRGVTTVVGTADGFTLSELNKWIVKA